MANQNDNNSQVGSASEGGKLDTTFPSGGVGKPSDDQPTLPTRQPIATPGDVTPRRKK